MSDINNNNEKINTDIENESTAEPVEGDLTDTRTDETVADKTADEVVPESEVKDNGDNEKDAELQESENKQKEDKEEEKKAKRLKDIVDYIEIFVFAVSFVILLFSFCCRLCTVSGPSMNNTLIDGERVVISDIFYTPKRGDIIVFHDTNTLNEPVIKRVIATEGEKVSITYTNSTMRVEVTDENGNVSVLEEDYIVYEFPSYAPATYTVPEGKVFVMGDNRSHSMDSRHPDISFVDERSILGRVLFRITPISKFGTVN